MRVGLVGAGFMGRSYANLIHHHPVATLAGVADSDLVSAAALGAAYGVPGVTGVDDMLDAGPLDGLIVATDEASHLQPALAGIARGVGVLVEKPLAATVADAERIVVAATRTGTVLLVGHILRFDTRYALLREAVQLGEVGQPLTVYARRWNVKTSQERLAGRTSLTLYLGVHDFDIVRWTVGREVERVVAVERRGFFAGRGDNVADAVTALLTFADGTLATVDLNWVMPAGQPIGFDFRLEVLGTIGSAKVIADYSGLTVTGDARESWVDTALWPTVQGRVSGALARQVDHFIACLQGEAEPLVTGDDGLAAVRIAVAVDEAARTGQPVDLTSEDTLVASDAGKS